MREPGRFPKIDLYREGLCDHFKGFIKIGRRVNVYRRLTFYNFNFKTEINFHRNFSEHVEDDREDGLVDPNPLASESLPQVFRQQDEKNCLKTKIYFI